MSLLNWNSGQHFDHGDTCACTQCGKPTPLRAHSGEPVYKVCAETWNDDHPTAPRHEHDGRDLGTTRYYSDPPRKSSKEGTR